MKQPDSSSRKASVARSLIAGCLILVTSITVGQAQTGIDDVVRTALETNPEMQVHWYDFRSAGYATEAARGGFRPQISIDAAYGRQRENFVTKQPMNTGFAELSVTQLLWDGGRTSANVAEFDNAELVRYFELLDNAETTALEAVRAYLDVLRYRELVRLAEDNLQTHREVYDRVAESVEAGVARSADLEQINGRLALAEANLINEQSNLHDVSARYIRIIGERPPNQLDDVSLDADLPDTVSGALMQAYEHSPKYHASLRNIEAAGSAIEAQRAARLPRLNLTASYGVQTRDEFGFREEHTDGRIGIELTYDLYTGGRDSANVRRAVALQNSAMSLRDRACVDIRQEVQIAYNDLQKIEQRLPILNQHRLSSDRVRTAYKQQFEIGQRTLLDLLDSENEFFEASRAWTNSSFDKTLASARTLSAMGLLLESLNVHRTDIPSLSELGAEPIPVDPSTACPSLPDGGHAMSTPLSHRSERSSPNTSSARQLSSSLVVPANTFNRQTEEKLDQFSEQIARRMQLSE